MKCPNCNADNPDTKQFCGDCGTSLTPSEDGHPSITKTIEKPREELTTGATFAGRYQIIEELGKGGMGTVYKVLDKETEEKIALKLIKPEIAAEKNTIERFRNELTTARKIRHKNVCAMYDLNRENENYYITMEYVSGGDLKKFIRRSKRLDIGTAISIAKQVCGGLTEAHGLGIVHRDLKPNNIMIDDRGNAKIMDFGIARSVKSKGITGSGVMIGTPEYMSPEQVDGKDVDSRTDIYAMGIILYEMLTGQLPFVGDTPFTVGVKQKSETPENPKTINPNLSDDLCSVILKCLEKDRDSRYQSTEELCAELTRIEKGLPTTARVAPARKPLTSREITVQFNPRKVALPILALAIAAVGLILWQPWKSRAPASVAEDKPSLAVMYFENNTGDEALDHWRKGISDLLIYDLTQSRYLKVLGGDRLFDILSGLNQLDATSYSSDVLQEVAFQGGVNHIARGSYTKAGDVLRIDIVLQNAQSGEPIATKRVEGKGQEAVFTMVDELTIWVKESLRLSSEQLASDLDKQIGTVTTSSPDAYKFYSEGINFFDKEMYEESIPSFEKAIALDPRFAMAYRKMAVAYGNSAKWEERSKYMQKALELSDRLTERERLLIEGGYFGSSLSTYDKAIASYDRLIALYPDSYESQIANVNLGGICADMDEWDRAIEYNQAALEADTDIRITYTNLAIAYMAKGDYGKAEEVLEGAVDRFSNFLRGHWILAQVYAFQGKFDLAMEQVDKAAAIDPTYTPAQFYHMMWDFGKTEEGYVKWLEHVDPDTHLLARQRLYLLYQTLGKFEEAENQILLAIEGAKAQQNDRTLSNYYYNLAYFYLKTGKAEKALDAAEANERIDLSGPRDIAVKIRNLELKGWIYAGMDRIDEALKAAEEIKDLVDASLYGKLIRHYHFLMGMIQRQNKDYPKAVESIQMAATMQPHPWGFLSFELPYRYYLALAHFESGDLRTAADSFEELIAFIPGRNEFGDLYAESYYRLGMIYQQLNDPTKALANYQKFLELWKDADPGLPKVAEARERVARLKAP